MSRVLCLLLFCLAAGAAFAASTGVAAPPHRVAAGTPLNHNLVLGAYRFAFLIEPVSVDGVLTPEMEALHKAFALAGLPMTEMPGMSPSSHSDLPLIATGGLHPMHDLAITLALLVVLAPRLPRPTPRLQAQLRPFALRAAQWRPALPSCSRATEHCGSRPHRSSRGANGWGAVAGGSQRAYRIRRIIAEGDSHVWNCGADATEARYGSEAQG